MSDHSPPTASLPPGVEPQDNEQLAWGRIGVLAAGALTVFLVGSLFAVWLLNLTQGSVAQRSVNQHVADCVKDPSACAQVGIVETRPIELETRAVDMKAKARVRLSTYGWMDEPAQLVHIPIEEGMKKVLEGERP